jgi:CHAT domain-containing protein/Tfp pilus assembly protein PilF
MRYRRFISSLIAATVLGVPLISPQPTQAQDISFYCGSRDDVPTTYIRINQEDIAFITWVSEYFADSELNPQQQCDEASARFQQAYSNGNLNYITTGRMNRLPVVCASQREGGSCKELLFILPPTSNPSAVLRQLFRLPRSANGLFIGGLSDGLVGEAPRRQQLYVDFQEELIAARIEAGDSLPIGAPGVVDSSTLDSREASEPNRTQPSDVLLGTGQVGSDRYKTATELVNRGRRLGNLGQFSEAIEAYNQAIAIYQEIGDRRGEGMVLSAIASLHAVSSNLTAVPSASTITGSTLSSSELQGRTSQRISPSLSQGFSSLIGDNLSYTDSIRGRRRERGERGDSLSPLTTTGGGYIPSASRPLRSRRYMSLGRGSGLRSSRLEERGDNGSASGRANVGIGDNGSVSNSPAVEPTMSNSITTRLFNPDDAAQSVSAASSGRVDENFQALDYYQRALTIFRNVDDLPKQAATLNEIGIIYEGLGRYSNSLEVYQQAFEIFQDGEDSSNKGITLNNIGEVHRKRGQYSLALENFNQALQTFQSNQYPLGQGATLNNIGLIYQDLGQYTTALSFYQRSLAQRQAANDSRGQAITLHNIGLAHDLLEDEDQALKFYQQALALNEERGDVLGYASTLNNLGLLYNDKGQHEQAISSLNQALTIFTDAGDRPNQGNTLDSLGTVYKTKGEYAKALDYYQQALKILQEVGDRPGVGIVLTNIGELQERQGKPAEAIQFYKQAIDTVVETTLAELKGEELQVAFADKHADTYAKLIKLLWDQGRIEDAFNYSERARARVFLNQFADRSINLRPNAASSEQIQKIQTLGLEINEISTQIVSLNRLANTSDTSEKISSLRQQLATHEQVYATLITQLRQENLEAADLFSTNPATLSEIQAQLDTETTLVSYFVTDDRTFAFLVTHDSLTPVLLKVDRQTLQNQIQRLYDYDFAALNDPHPATLRQLHTWLIQPLASHLVNRKLEIVPHNVLHYVPFSALTDGKNYLIDQHTLTYLPSASIKRFIAAKRKLGSETMMALGNPTFDLFYAKREVETISNLYRSQPRVGNLATEDSIRAEARQAGILHLATHGQYDPINPLLSTLYLAPSTENDGRLQVYEIYGLDLTAQTRLVVLSACQTQIGQLSRGDEIIGLSRAFLFAGTPSVMASLWNIDDQATSDLMQNFYQYLQQGSSQAEALQKAQRATRSRYPHPYYWAAFTLTGDGL